MKQNGVESNIERADRVKVNPKFNMKILFEEE